MQFLVGRKQCAPRGKLLRKAGNNSIIQVGGSDYVLIKGFCANWDNLQQIHIYTYILIVLSLKLCTNWSFCRQVFIAFSICFCAVFF